MRIEFIKSLWGFEDVPLADMLTRIRLAGYAGLESPMVLDRSVIQDCGLDYVAQGFPVTLDDLQADIEKAHDFGAAILNLNFGRDHWPRELSLKMLEGAARLAEEAPLPVLFETHRGRLFHSASSTLDFLTQFPSLRLTADYSHWTCVSESLLADQGDAVQKAIEHSNYLHARVGHEEGPQVPDPRADRWQTQMTAFEGWWKRIVQANEDRGVEVLRINPEFGPANYMPMDPNGDRPLADLWDVCMWMRERLMSTLLFP